MTVKDVFETEGLVTTSGAPELAQYVPDTDALAVARLKGAGAVIFGKSNTPLYAGDWQTYNDVYGRTGNPWDTSRTAGGSSGGAAAAVAAGLTPLELGSDIGGSIRNPSHYNGVYGLKPSWGIVPVRGHIPGPPGSLVTVDVGVAGPIGRSVADLRTALQVMAGPLPEDAPGWRLELDAGPPVGAAANCAWRRSSPTASRRRSAWPATCAPAWTPSPARPRTRARRWRPSRCRSSLADGFATWRDLTLPTIGLGLPDAEYARLAAAGAAPGDDASADDRPGHDQ